MSGSNLNDEMDKIRKGRKKAQEKARQPDPAPAEDDIKAEMIDDRKARGKKAEKPAAQPETTVDVVDFGDDADAIRALKSSSKPQDMTKLEAEAEEKEEPRVYVVQSGDSLSKIAKEVYGKAGRWKEIYEANKDQIKDPGLIRPGWKLRIP